MGSDNTRENNASTVLRLAYGNFSFLLMGDAEGKQRNQPENTSRFVEQQLLHQVQPAQLQSTLLKAGHHGSETGSTLRFLETVKPQVVVVMSGRKSFSGTFLPDASVLERYRRVLPGATVVRTDYRDADEGRDTTNDADGDDVLAYTDGESLRVYQARLSGGARRWRLIRKLP
jgi:beta-lactamase superfamily II metal-dependent hydrolase